MRNNELYWSGLTQRPLCAACLLCLVLGTDFGCQELYLRPVLVTKFGVGVLGQLVMGGGGGGRFWHPKSVRETCHKNFGPRDQNSWKIGPPDHYFWKFLVRAWNYGPSENTLV